MKKKPIELLMAPVMAMALITSSTVSTAGEEEYAGKAQYKPYWNETVEPVGRSPWIYEGTRVFRGVARVPSSDSVRPLEQGQYPTELGSFTFLASDNKEHNISEWLNKTHTDSFLIYQDGKLIVEKYFNGMRSDSPHRIHSITKTVAGMIAGQAVEAGKLDPDKLVTDYLPQLKGSTFKDTKVRHVLDMTAALSWIEGGIDAVSMNCAFGRDIPEMSETFGIDLSEFTEVCESLPDVNSYLISLRDNRGSAEDGEIFDYRSLLTVLLGMLIESATGESYVELLSDMWQGIGAQDAAFIERGADGVAQNSGGLHTTSRDLLRFGLMMLDNGKVNGTQIVPANWIADTIQGNEEATAAYEKSSYADGFKGFYYRNKTWVKDSKKGEFYGIGVFGQLLYVNQEANVVIVKLSSQPDNQNMFMYLDSMAAIEQITETLTK